MNIAIIILIAIVAIIAIPLIIALFVKKDYTVEKEILINKDKNAVFDYIKHIKNQDQYSVWVMMDPNSKRTYTGTDGTAGFVYQWESENKKVGHGIQTITKVNEGEKIEFLLHFLKPFEGKAHGYMSAETIADGQTKVKWGFKSSMKYPSNFMLLIMDLPKMLGNDMMVSLVNLKKVLES
ncbi:MAG: SRPBCC family protein [Bacteroidetes bacterium]|nr:SRPBCC family protein [Bacteroidota bacterium]